MKKGWLVVISLVAAITLLGVAGCPRAPALIPPPAPPPRPGIPIKQEPADRYISSTIGETMTFSVTTEEAVTVTWEMHQIRSGPRIPLAKPPVRPLRPEPVPPPPVADEPSPFWEIGQDVNVTFSEVRITPPEVGHFRVTATAATLVDGEVKCVGSAVWDWEVEEGP